MQKTALNHLFDFRLKEWPRHFFVKFTLSVFHWPQRWALHSDPQVREAPAVSCQQQPVTSYVHDLTKRIFRMNGGRSLQWHFLWVDYPLFVWKVANKTNRSLWIWNSFIMLCLGQRGHLIAAFAVMLRPVQICSTLKDRYQSEHVFNGMCEGDCIDVSTARWISKRDALNLTPVAAGWQWNALDWEYRQCQHSLDKALNEMES